MTTWVYPVHSMHPWFRSPSLKRKASSSDEDEDELSIQIPPTHSDAPALPAKRRRCDVLERGIAQLSLNTTAAGTSVPPAAAAAAATLSTSDVPQVESATEDGFANPIILSSIPPSSAASSPTYTFVQQPLLSGVLQPGSVEEPPSPEQVFEEVQDVPMASGSWYELEKDRIVVTDLSDFIEEGEEKEEAPGCDSGGIVIPDSVLRHFSKRTLANATDALPTPEPPNNALILYRPLPLTEPESSSAARIQDEARIVDTQPQLDGPVVPPDDDDAMDVEPL